MTLAASLVAHITAQFALQEYLGNPMRFLAFPLPPQEKGAVFLPATVYRQTSLSREDTLTGQVILARPLIEFATFVDPDIEGGGYDIAHTISDLFTSILVGFKGQMGGGVWIENIKRTDERDDYDSETDLLAVINEFEITYR